MAPDLTQNIERVGTTSSDADIMKVTLSNGTLSVALLNLGAIVQDVRLQDVPYSLTLGTDDVAAYLGAMSSCGSLIGPVVNRISGASAVLNGERYDFEVNYPGNITLHSGSVGTQHRLWDIAERSETTVTFETTLADGEGGFPGNRVVAARYKLLPPATLELRVTATTDAPTWINFANHSYWNLDGTDTYEGHRLTVAADRYCLADANDMATGEVVAVDGTPFDFRNGRTLHPGKDVKYDHGMCLADARMSPREVLLLEGTSGVSMRLSTSEPGVQIYDAGGFGTGGSLAHDGRTPGAHAAVAIEAQGWPDAPNQKHFPSVVVRPGTAYQQITRFAFSR